MIKAVDFEYCNKCIFKNKLETEEPCCDCMEELGNEDSHRPVYFKEKEGAKTNG